MLRVFYPEAPVAWAILIHHAFKDVELRANRAVTDRVHHHLQSRAVRRLCPGVQTLRRRNEETAVPGRITEWRKHCRRVRAERPIDKGFQTANVEPDVTAAARSHRVTQRGPTCERNLRHDPRAQPVGVVRAPNRGESFKVPHVVDARHAARRDIGHRRIECAIPLRVAARRLHDINQRHRVVLEDSGQLTLRITHDRAAVDVFRVAIDLRGRDGE